MITETVTLTVGGTVDARGHETSDVIVEPLSWTADVDGVVSLFPAPATPDCDCLSIGLGTAVITVTGTVQGSSNILTGTATAIVTDTGMTIEIGPPATGVMSLTVKRK